MSNRTPVIFIDDDQHIRMANTQTLDLAGFEVTGLERAERGLPLLSWDWPGVVVCDIRMQGMDGLEFLQRVREIDPDLPVILITGHGDISMAVQSIRIGQGQAIITQYSGVAAQLFDWGRAPHERVAGTQGQGDHRGHPSKGEAVGRVRGVRRTGGPLSRPGRRSGPGSCP